MMCQVAGMAVALCVQDNASAENINKKDYDIAR